jgi:hypothetical protein
MTTDERLDALAFTVENIAGIVKDMLEKQDAADARAEADRQIMHGAILEMRDGVATMIRIAESMEATARGLVQAQQGTSQRVDRLERRVDALENPDAA